MKTKSGRRTLAGIISKVRFEALERRILLSTGSIPPGVDPVIPGRQGFVAIELVSDNPTVVPYIPDLPAPVPLPPPTPNAPDVLDISHNPLYAVEGAPLSAEGQYLTVEALKPDGSVDTSYNGDITVGSSDGDLSGTLTLAATNGVATFTDLTLNSAGPYATFDVSDSNGDQQNNEFEFGILPAGSQPDNTPAQLVITQQPTVDPATGTFSLTAAILDRQGNPVANGALVQLQLFSGPAGAWVSSATGANQILVGNSLVPGNTALAQVDANGYATFTGLAFNVAGTYVLRLGVASPISSLLSDPFQAPALSGSSDTEAKFAAAPSPAAGVPDLSVFSRSQTNVVDQLLKPGGAAVGVLSILNSPFSGPAGNPLLS